MNEETAQRAEPPTASPGAAGRPGYLRMFGRLAAAGLRERMQYRTNFLVTAFIRAVLHVADFGVLAVILYRFRSLAGWNIYEIALLAGVSATGYGLYRVLGNELDHFERYMLSGDFDSVLIRPWPSLLTLLGRRVDFNLLGVVAQGLAVMALGVLGVTRQGALRGWEIAWVSLLPVSGAAVIFALGLVVAASGFWVVRIDELQVLALHAPLFAAQQPLSIYPSWLRGVLYTLIPLAYTSYLPLCYLLGKGAGPWALPLAAFVPAAALFGAYRFWLYGERHYQSTGS